MFPEFHAAPMEEPGSAASHEKTGFLIAGCLEGSRVQPWLIRCRVCTRVSADLVRI